MAALERGVLLTKHFFVRLYSERGKDLPLRLLMHALPSMAEEARRVPRTKLQSRVGNHYVVYKWDGRRLILVTFLPQGKKGSNAMEVAL